MTAALAENSVATSRHAAGRRSPEAQPRRPHLMPVPDSEPPVQPPRHDEFLRSAMITAFRDLERPLTPNPTRPDAPPRRDTGRGGAPRFPAPPTMEHRRWAPRRDRDEAQPLAPWGDGVPGQGTAGTAATRGVPANATIRTPASAQEAGRCRDRHLERPAPGGQQVHSAVGVALAAEPTNPAAAAESLAGTDMPRRLRAFDVATRLTQATIEALAGRRPLRHLRRHFTSGVFVGIEDFPMLGSRNAIRLTSLWVCEPAPDTAEVSAAFQCGPRTRALAMQLRAVDGRWLVTALQMG